MRQSYIAALSLAGDYHTAMAHMSDEMVDVRILSILLSATVDQEDSNTAVTLFNTFWKSLCEIKVC